MVYPHHRRHGRGGDRSSHLECSIDLSSYQHRLCVEVVDGKAPLVMSSLVAGSDWDLQVGVAPHKRKAVLGLV